MRFAELFEEFEDPLHRYAMSLVRNRDWADDLVQETFIRAGATSRCSGCCPSRSEGRGCGGC